MEKALSINCLSRRYLNARTTSHACRKRHRPGRFSGWITAYRMTNSMDHPCAMIKNDSMFPKKSCPSTWSSLYFNHQQTSANISCHWNAIVCSFILHPLSLSGVFLFHVLFGILFALAKREKNVEETPSLEAASAASLVGPVGCSWSLLRLYETRNWN